MNKATTPCERIETGLNDGPVAISALDSPADCGAEAAFIGRTRGETHPEHGPLIRLEYEAYRPMVESGLRELAEAVASKHGCRAIRAVHALGPVGLGEASVVVQVAAGHRDAAFTACRELIDRLKAELPIWKREVWQGGQTYVAGTPIHAKTSDGGHTADQSL